MARKQMRVFVTGTGRCGSVCFKSACLHMDNYTVGHETWCGLMEYPDNHIEINPQFRHALYHLIRKYPDAYYVHLIRNKEDCVKSLVKLNNGSVVEAYRLLYPTIIENDSLEAAAERFWEAENEIIRLQLQLADNRTTLHLETIKDDWRAFWQWIGAEGNYPASLAEWDTPKNTSQERVEKGIQDE